MKYNIGEFVLGDGVGVLVGVTVGVGVTEEVIVGVGVKIREHNVQLP
jgi:hypothetical protein